MKVILLKDMKKLGRAHDTIEVADGFALNSLIHQGAAISATAMAIKEAEGRKGKLAAKREEGAQSLKESLEALKGMTLTLKSKANEEGHLYTKVGESEIIAAAAAAGVSIPEGVLDLKAIKELGTHEVALSSGDISGTFSITVEAE